ncbi:hypothetical protein A1D23_09450 [Chelonobacter oris]|uniref:DUF3383 family protein n=1 Tax=Chelonobacter oris TaxID=505317 RepID=UPI00244A7576|nr:DUF3383 family protein [Chelonobacter oris]MDH3000645.1 hypothetical protein [Chelonobacter oris]
MTSQCYGFSYFIALWACRERFLAVCNALDLLNRFGVTIGSSKVVVSGLNLTECADFNAVASKITEKLTSQSVTVSYDPTGNRILLKASRAGENKSSLIFYA